MCSFKHAHICINTYAKMCLKALAQKNSMTSGKKFTFAFFKIAENFWFLIFCIVLCNVFTPTRKARDFKHATQ